MNNSINYSLPQRRWLNQYNRRIRELVGAELKRTLRTKTFFWMMEKTRSIPEWGEVDSDFFRGGPYANSSTFKACHNLVVSAILYHLWAGLSIHTILTF